MDLKKKTVLLADPSPLFSDGSFPTQRRHHSEDDLDPRAKANNRRANCHHRHRHRPFHPLHNRLLRIFQSRQDLQIGNDLWFWSVNRKERRTAIHQRTGGSRNALDAGAAAKCSGWSATSSGGTGEASVQWWLLDVLGNWKVLVRRFIICFWASPSLIWRIKDQTLFHAVHPMSFWD